MSIRRVLSSTAAKLGRAARERGARGAREVVKLFWEKGFSARRGDQSFSGASDPDVITEMPLWIEVKRCEKLNIYSAINQCLEDKNTKEYSVFFRKYGTEWHVCLRAELFLNMLQKLNSNKFKENCKETLAESDKLE